MEPEIHDGEVGLVVPMETPPRDDLCLFEVRGELMVARLTYNRVPGAMWDGEQMTIYRRNGSCSIADARIVKVLGRIAWHGRTVVLSDEHAQQSD